MKGNCGECNLRWACDIDPNKCNEWPDPTPMTNAQKIRSMSDEELAKLLCYTGWRMIEQKECLEWLQQPAEEDKNGV